ncbi:GNAT family N-acetyltransferase [Streptococcus sp. DD12]|uniref:GNAT family N-acetyltransferase n=1 Tax=Streptococcus sp. DD12 TaxID=1777880 RepID=UPI000799CE14|nr:GNAT family protein [Streptococcus sp. DD12]KXT76599.1 Acetyltransferase [Streptococcus sp. DD12]
MAHPSEKWAGRPLPDLETKRLHLRQRRLCDAPDILEFTRLPEVAYPAGFIPTQTLADQRTYLEVFYPKNLHDNKLPSGYGLTLKGEDRVIGSIDFNHRLADDVLEMGYLLSPDYWCMGLMTEAAEAFLQQAFEGLALTKVELECYDYNHASRRLANKLGFQEEARLRARKDVRGERCDILRFGLLKSEWQGHQKRLQEGDDR